MAGIEAEANKVTKVSQLTNDSMYIKTAQILTRSESVSKEYTAPYIAKIDNVFNKFDQRWKVTTTGNYSGYIRNLFDVIMTLLLL